MLIEINGKMQVKEIKKQFHYWFPNLKIEFFRTEHSGNEAQSKSEQLSNEFLIHDLESVKYGDFQFESNMTVKAFEDKFKDEFGLNIQVFRKSGAVYIETTKSDSMTLEQAEGEASLTPGSNEDESLDLTDRDKWE